MHRSGVGRSGKNPLEHAPQVPETLRVSHRGMGYLGRRETPDSADELVLRAGPVRGKARAVLAKWWGISARQYSYY